LDGLPKVHAESSDSFEEGETTLVEPESRPTAADIKAAVSEAHEIDGTMSNDNDVETDEDIAAKCNRQTEPWGRIRELTRRYAGLPEDFDDDIAVVVGEMVVTLAPERGYELPYSAQLAGVDRWTLIRV
jgi:hypothetical protein